MPRGNPGTEAVRTLERALGPDRLRRNVPLAPLTTIRMGGPADLFFEARSASELESALKLARSMDIPHVLLGVGANVVVGDLGFRGLVIRNCARGMRIDRKSGQVWTESGAIMDPDVIGGAVSAGLSGIEHYVGIPSTVGGALWQNLHFLSPDRSRTMFIEEVVLEAELLTEEGQRRRVGVDYFDFGYDYSTLHVRDDIVLTATFQLRPGEERQMRRLMAANLRWRALRHPPLDTEPSVGSIYKKIDGIGAGRLIDECGLKGATIGGVTVTHRHANILVNLGSGRAADLQALLAHIEQSVRERTGYSLETEIDFVGEFAPPNKAAPVFLPRPPGLVTAEERARAASGRPA